MTQLKQNVFFMGNKLNFKIVELLHHFIFIFIFKVKLEKRISFFDLKY